MCDWWTSQNRQLVTVLYPVIPYMCCLLTACMYVFKSFRKRQREGYDISLFFNSILCMYKSVLLICMSVHHSKPGALEGRKNVSDSLGPELQKVVSLHAGAGNQNGSSGRVARALKPRHLIPDILS